MKREEILKLIEDKEAKDLVFKTRGEEKAKRTEEIFHIIKQDVMDKVVEHCIEHGYCIHKNVVHLLTLMSLLDNEEFPVNNTNCKIKTLTFSYFLSPCAGENLEEIDEVRNFVTSFDDRLLFDNIERLVKQHGFEEEQYGYFIEYTTTKEKLLSFSEIISNDVYQPKTVKTIKNPLYNVHVRDAKLVTSLEKDNTLTYQILGVIVFFIILFIWKVCF